MRKFGFLLCVAMAFGQQNAAYAQKGDAPVEIKPAANTRTLSCSAALEVTYQRWPRNTVDRYYLQAWLPQTRQQVSALRAAIRTKGLDADVAAAYDDCLKLLDQYEAYLANLGAIDRNQMQRAQEDSGAVARTAFRLSYDTAQQARQNGSSAGDSIVGGTLVGISGWGPGVITSQHTAA